MTWWSELPHWIRELIAMWGAFIAMVFVICGGARLAEWRRRRRSD